ncbi:DUF3467 domain-containing protein [Siphonobacter aquaeclarae]|jgi:hypothetical protein|uniref:DUF3467 domain-containing protein n=1 Tax=Siphonobacter aquaeclarae TaxID=563176 RepID=A0A1G9VEI7_9BACT|nr:DUF3467 domain-containing protein [Siphonobacter aquaeclarae]MBO9639485.1 DUF3467 domain-containing protein [Siphonobacter aquaeclarae]SDM70491.1 Protein of unknown function [Siphonobacter aquaeclarae]
MAKQQAADQGDQIEIELSEEMAEGTYSNLAIISHSQSEFVIDFVRLMPNVPKAKVKSRVIITPDHALRLMNALQDNIAKYEENYGPINEGGGPSGFQFPTNYNGPIGEA